MIELITLFLGLITGPHPVPVPHRLEAQAFDAAGDHLAGRPAGVCRRDRGLARPDRWRAGVVKLVR